MAEIIRPTVAEMARRGTPFQGILYAGLMIKDGQPRLVEYNVRFGDPECQGLMIRLGAQVLSDPRHDSRARSIRLPGRTSSKTLELGGARAALPSVRRANDSVVQSCHLSLGQGDTPKDVLSG